MDAKYEESIKRLKQCWKEQRHVITDEEKAAMKSFRGYFLSNKSETYSHEVALKWLSDNQVTWDDEKYQQIVSLFTSSTMLLPMVRSKQTMIFCRLYMTHFPRI